MPIQVIVVFVSSSFGLVIRVLIPSFNDDDKDWGGIEVPY